jgi:hypothetical protein
MMLTGKYLRHVIAVLVAALFTWMVDQLPFITTIATPEQLMIAQEVLVGFLTFIGGAVMLLAYAGVERFLKRYQRLDPEGHRDRAASRS